MDLLAGFILGLSVIIKPITILMIPFLILIHYDYNEKKLKVIFTKSIFRLIGVVLPISLNLLMFINIPGLLDGFINVNLTGADTLIPNHSFSITKIVSNLFIYIGLPLNSTQVLAIFLSMTIALGIIGFIAYILIRISKISIIYGYVISLLIMLLAYFDSWDHHLLNLLPLLIIIIFTNPQTSQIIKMSIRPSFFFLCFLDLAFMGLFWLLNPSSSNLLFPFNFVPTIFLAYTFYGIIKICIKKP